MEAYRELVRQVVEAVNDDDLDALTRWMHPDCVFDWSASKGPQRGVYEGLAAFSAFFAGFREVLDNLVWEVTSVEEVPAGLLITTRFGGRGRGSGVPSAARGAQVWQLREGRARRVTMFQDRDEALAWVRREERRGRLAQARLYFVCEGRPHGADPRPLLDAALGAGVDVVQLRDKQVRSDEAIVELALPFREAAMAVGALFMLNDRPDLVGSVAADGVHVGQDDMPVDEAREAAGLSALVGLSTHSPEQLRAAHAAEGEARPDTISVGPVWPTPTKQGRASTGLQYVELAAREATLPWFAIGGIDRRNIAEVALAGAGRAVVVRAIRDADDPAEAAAQLRRALEPPAP